MPESINSLPPEDEIPQTDKTPDSNHEERFQSDTQKLVRHHLENEDHQFTEEEIRNVRVGMNPPDLDAPTEARLESDEAVEKVEKEILKDRNIEEDENTGKDKLTPWDTIDR